MPPRIPGTKGTQIILLGSSCSRAKSSLFVCMYCHFAFLCQACHHPQGPFCPFLLPNSPSQWSQMQALVLLKIPPHMSSYLEAVLITPEDSDPVIPWGSGGQRCPHRTGASLQDIPSPHSGNPSCQTWSEETVLQSPRVKDPLHLFGVVHFNRVRA